MERRVRHLEIGVFAVEHIEAVVVLGRNDQVLHTGIVGHLGPSLRIESHRIELLCKLIMVPMGIWADSRIHSA